MRRSDGSAQSMMQRSAKHEQAAAQLLYSYMSYRAQREGVGYELNPAFFLGALHGGCSTFLGVTVLDGKLVKDEQFPEYFTDWQKQKHLN